MPIKKRIQENPVDSTSKPKKLNLLPILVVLIVILVLANLFFLTNFLKDVDIVFEFRPKTQNNANSVLEDQQNSVSSGQNSQNSASDTQKIEENSALSNEISEEQKVYRTMEISEDLREKVLTVALKNQTVQDLELNAASQIEIVFLPKEKILEEKESNQLFQVLPEKDLFQVNYASEKGNFFGVIDLNPEQVLLFYKVLSPIEFG